MPSETKLCPELRISEFIPSFFNIYVFPFLPDNSQRQPFDPNY